MSRLAPVPPTPNCVSSRADPKDSVHYIAPLEGVDLAAVREVMAATPRTKLVREEPGYLRYEVRTALLRFVDDVEFEQEGGVVHVRSASRVGRSDLGVNRRRVELIRKGLS